MRVVETCPLVLAGGFPESPEWQSVLEDVADAVKAITWPPESPSGLFVIYPESGKKRGHGNGVVPIKKAFLARLKVRGWSTNERQNPDRFDAVKQLANGRFVGLEWETGNISSSHRSLNRMLRAHLDGSLAGGVLVLPTARLAAYLTDRIGNYEELMLYSTVWVTDQRWREAALAVVAIEHDAESVDVPRIEKGTDGRALL